MKFLAATFAILVIAAITLDSCKGTLDSSTGQSDIVFPASNVSYTKQVVPLFYESCNFVGCHNSEDQAGGLDLSTTFGVFSVPGVVIAKDTLHSILIQRITGRVGTIMPPPPYSPLNQNQIQGLKKWIMEGANDGN